MMHLYRYWQQALLLLLFLGLGEQAYAQQPDMKKLEALKPRNIGPAGMSGRVTSIDVVRDNPNVIFIGTASGGVWKSESGGIAWEPVFDEQPVQSIGAVAIQQSNPSVIWVGTGEGNPRNSQSQGAGIFKSLDGGKTWKRMGLENTRTIHRVIINPLNPEEVYAAAMGTAWGDTEERGVYKTTDGGQSWEKVLFVNTRTGAGDLIMDPENPNKLFAAMWEYRRWPWFFKSGGEGSGLYVTHDGGQNWERLTEEEGLPEGDLGRMGLAIAPSDPDRVYALIESKKNALYRSDDGGSKWRKINEQEEIGNRPFYYADIFVDPKNENRIYSLYSIVSKSEDGGKSFDVLLPYSGVHPDHHAWYIHPENTDFLIDGNDGGLNISRDRGENWQFVENLPLAQFYHITVDMEQPYNVYGGMQDNGSWRGPGYVWKSGGIRNHLWQELFFGDGFDVMPDPTNVRYGYAMSQGGNLGRYDLATGNAKLIKPVHPEGETLRFNWNAGLAQDPFDAQTIYYGSQYVHKSTDKGDTWEIISTDLTTNDPAKQKQQESGGLTFDVTAAENHTTILAIAPSPVQEGVLWAGTDDGNVQLTQDGGRSWTNLTGKLKGLPAGAWVPQIQASKQNAGEAFVVVNDYRRNNWQPMLYHTTNFGKSWTNLAENKGIEGYVLSVVQDPEEPKLLFMGTEFGLYVSFDYGRSWNKWGKGYPSVSTIDMAIHPREHDLVIATFGRSAWVLDDIRPLREIARQGTGIFDKTLAAFPAPDAVLAEYQEAAGTRFAANAIYSGENKPYGAMLTYWVKEGSKDKNKRKKAQEQNGGTAKSETEKETADEDKATSDSVRIEIADESGAIIRTLRHLPESGMNRLYWELDTKGVRGPTAGEPKKGAQEPGGGSLLPGTYTVFFNYEGVKDSTKVNVLSDPRFEVSRTDLASRKEILDRYQSLTAVATEAVQQLKGASATIGQVLQQMPEEKTDELKALEKRSRNLQDSLQTIVELINPKEDVQGIFRNPDILSSRLGMLGYYLGTNAGAPTATHQLLITQLEDELMRVVSTVNGFFANEWEDYKQAVNEARLSPFRPYEPLEIE